jgi:hypothetical protein
MKKKREFKAYVDSTLNDAQQKLLHLVQVKNVKEAVTAASASASASAVAADKAAADADVEAPEQQQEEEEEKGEETKALLEAAKLKHENFHPVSTKHGATTLSTAHQFNNDLSLLIPASQPHHPSHTTSYLRHRFGFLGAFSLSLSPSFSLSLSPFLSFSGRCPPSSQRSS